MGVPVTAAVVVAVTEALPPINHACRAGGVPMRLLAGAAMRDRAALLARARAPALIPEPAPMSAPDAPDPAPFTLLAAAIDGALARTRREIEALEAIEARPRPHGREHGLEWVHEERLIEDGRLEQVAALLRALAPHEAAVRALAGRPT